MEVEQFLTECSGLLLALDELRKDIPKLESMTSDIKIDISQFSKNISKSKSEYETDKNILKTECEKLIDKIEKEQNKFKTISSSIDEDIKNITEAKKYILSIKDESNEKLNLAMDRIDKLEQQIEHLVKICNEKQIEKTQVQDKTSNKKESVKEKNESLDDYKKPNTIEYLYNKYAKSDTPVIVRRIENTKWTADYVFNSSYNNRCV